MGSYSVTQPGSAGMNNSPLVGDPASTWAHHQEWAHRLSIYARQQSGGDCYPDEGTVRSSAQPVPQYNETSDDDDYHLGFGALPHREARYPNPAHQGMERGGNEWFSRHDWYEAPYRPAPTRRPRQNEYGMLQYPAAD